MDSTKTTEKRESVDGAFVPTPTERVGLTANYTKLNAEWPNWAPYDPLLFRILMIIGRNTYGRVKNGWPKEWDKMAHQYISQRVGWYGLTPSVGVNRTRLIEALNALEWFDYIESRSGKTGEMKEWRINPEGDNTYINKKVILQSMFTIQRRFTKNIREMGPADRLRDKELQRQCAQMERGLGRRLTDNEKLGLERALLDKPFLETNFVQWANCFEDVMGPNIPRRLYRLLMRVWTETHGRLNHDRDTYARVRPWRASMPEVASEMLLNSRETAEEYTEFAEYWGFLTVLRKPGMKNMYLPGPHMWRLVKTGDLSSEYREAFNIKSKPGWPALLPKATKKAQTKTAPRAHPGVYEYTPPVFSSTPTPVPAGTW